MERLRTIGETNLLKIDILASTRSPNDLPATAGTRGTPNNDSSIDVEMAIIRRKLNPNVMQK